MHTACKIWYDTTCSDVRSRLTFSTFFPFSSSSSSSTPQQHLPRLGLCRERREGDCLVVRQGRGVRVHWCRRRMDLRVSSSLSVLLGHNTPKRLPALYGRPGHCALLPAACARTGVNSFFSFAGHLGLGRGTRERERAFYLDFVILVCPVVVSLLFCPSAVAGPVSADCA